MVRYTASEVNLTEFAEKRKIVQNTAERAESPGGETKSPNGLSSRRKENTNNIFSEAGRGRGGWGG